MREEPFYQSSQCKQKQRCHKKRGNPTSKGNSKKIKNTEKPTRLRYPMNLKTQAILLRRQNMKPKAIHQWFLKQRM